MRELRALLDEGLERGFFAGAAAVIAGAEGALVEEYRGAARVVPQAEKGDAAPETLWDLGELTEPLAGAALVLGLARERAFSLDDPIGRFADPWKRTRFDGVTLRFLLRHQGGLRAWFPCYVRGEGRKAYARTLAEVDPAGPPGRAVVISSLGFLMLAEAVERAAAAPIDVLFRDRVAGPLDVAADLLFAPAGADRVRAAGGERGEASERRRVRDLGLAYLGFREGIVSGEANDGNAWRRAAGVSLNAGLFGTARAVAEAGRAWMERDARMLHEADAVDAVRDHASGAHRGLGWETGREPLSADSFGAAGETGASLFVDPPRRLVLVLLANRLHPEARPGDMDEFRRRFHELARDAT